MSRHAVASVCGLLAVLILVAGAAAEPVVAPPPRPAAGALLARGRAFAEKGRVDLFVAATKAWDLPAEDDRLWQPALDLAWALVKKGDFRWWPLASNGKAFDSMAAYRAWFHPRFIRADEPYEQEKSVSYYQGGIMAPGVSSPAALGDNIIVSRGDVRTAKPLDNCIVFANGDVTVGRNLSGSVVVCDGDVTVETHVTRSLVVARGSIRVKTGITSTSTLVAGGSAKVDKRVPAPPRDVPVVEEDQRRPFGFVTFFELSRVGLAAKVADGAVWVGDVAEGGPFAKAGGRTGDTVMSVNGKKPDSVESFRRLLRDALAVGDATVTLRRGDRTETITITLPD